MKTPPQPEDPIVSPAWMADDADISEATWYRNYRYHPKLKIIQISPRRIGARLSNWRQVVAEQAEGEAA
jgi:hypothetical protein